jgi:phosphoglycolate phosphatase
MPSSAPRPCRLFLFDLDGTLIDSKGDIATALNLALGRAGLRRLPPSRIAGFIGDGVRKLVERSLREALGCEPDEPLLHRVTDLYLEEYAEHLLDTTCLFQGVEEVLESLDWAELAVVTNKPERFSRQILDALGIGRRFRLVFGGDSTRLRKPDPAPLLEAMRRCGADPGESVMVGDSPVDVQAGKAAGAVTCGIAANAVDRDKLSAAGCDLLIGDMRELTVYFCPPADR